MARFDPWGEAVCLPDPTPVTRTLQAPGCEDLAVTLCKLDEFDEQAVLDTVADWQQRYLKGKDPLAIPDKVRAKLSRAMLHNVAVIMRMEQVAEVEPTYDLAGWLGIAKNQNGIWRELIRFVNEVSAAGDPKN